MKFGVATSSAAEALFSNPMRSLLTMLGIIIGVGNVIVMVSLVEGVRERVTQEFQSIGSNLIFAVYSPERRGAGAAPGSF